MKASARKNEVAFESDAEQPFRLPREHELHERSLEALDICADWKEELQRRQQRLLLRAELIGGVDEEEVEGLRADLARLNQCMRVLAWRVGE